ncbi:Uncharacterised protein [Vibrio cholerae]|nr:Uncharacterised protein [Vibrio cholerae]CSB82451.1 Uncharacterised protein [Vibrio cholerae]CSI60081.1 Uncharacterised protein [Vibrio cholerae]
MRIKTFTDQGNKQRFGGNSTTVRRYGTDRAILTN